MALRIGHVKGVYKGVLLALLIGATLLNLDKINVERYETLTNLENDYNLEEGGRWDVWKKGFIILAGRPLTGVGPGNFGMAIGNYRRDEGEFPKWQAAHSSFVQVLVEVGVIGGGIWLTLLWSTAGTFWRLRKRADPDGEMAIWAGALFIGFVAQMISSAFLSMGYSIYYTLFFAIAVSLRHIASVRHHVELPAATGSAVRRPVRRPLPQSSRP
jgi:O-antigen ligase